MVGVEGGVGEDERDGGVVLGVVADWKGDVGGFRGEIGCRGGCGFDYWQDVGGADAYMQINLSLEGGARFNYGKRAPD